MSGWGPCQEVLPHPDTVAISSVYWDWAEAGRQMGDMVWEKVTGRARVTMEKS